MSIEIHFDNVAPLTLEAGLDTDCSWYGLRRNPSADLIKPFPDDVGNILRYNALNDLPTGQIESVEQTIDSNGQCVRVCFSIADQQILFSAGMIAFEYNIPFVVEPQEFVLLATTSGKNCPPSA